METNTTTATADRSLARAVLARVLKIAFQPPTEKTLQALFSTDARAALEIGASRLERGHRAELSQAVDDLYRGPFPPLPELHSTYQTLFGHSLRGRVCPYESEYGAHALLQQAQELADLAGFYRAFGLGVAAQGKERPDHVACELEFLEFLSLKQAYAAEENDPEMLEVTTEAVRKFLAQHLGRFGPAFGRCLERADPDGLYGKLGRVCEVLVGLECEALGVPPGPPALELRSWEPDDVPMACGSCPLAPSDLVQVGGPGGERR